ncbi:ATP-dependent helicase [Lamprobacter modestohalophilus]|uniref:ATP-dependent helicase n=1 Tax=Lamprobacter modestohalophilus TaxID=1064514 RepID=UPI002ADEC371|nr:ATP-dependent helicase [Lamprobacter modestohalophilus]MEA1052710.1 ATP-dependent helicase [Lamprobacter modestohalophilus]
MAFTTNQESERAREELSVLDGVIDYAERMIYEEQQGQYQPLRRHAYGKTVVIETEKEGVKTFRLSSTPAVYPNAKSGYATPHSPVGRLCSVLQPDDEDWTPRWGDYRVLEIRLFDRFDGPQFEPNVRNFLSMAIIGEEGKSKVADVRAFLAGTKSAARPQRKPAPAAPPAPIAATPVDLATEPEASIVPVEKPSISTLTIDTLAVIDDDDEGLEPDLEFEEEDDSEQRTHAAEDYFGLSETFFVNRTRDQDAVISRSPIGPMFVDGVAGSGKTSAALGRTKMLCDYNAVNVSEEATFRDIAGDRLEYWSSEFAGQFSQESSVGFVRTGELIQYLKETCRRLDLPNLPVSEYPELRSRLRQHRRVDRSRANSPRWKGLGEPRATHTDTTMRWLKAVDRAMAAELAKTLEGRLPSAADISNGFDPKDRSLAFRVASAALDRLTPAIVKLAQGLEQSANSGGFLLDGLAARLDEKTEEVRRAVLDSDVLWVSVGERSWTATRELGLAQQLVEDRVALYLDTPARLVFLSEDGPLDTRLILLSTAGDPLPWSDETRVLLEQGEVLVRDSDGRTLRAQAFNTEDLFLLLLPEARQKLFVLEGNGLRRLKVQRGLGRVRLARLPKPAARGKEDPESDDLESDSSVNEAQTQHRSVDLVFRDAVKSALLEPLLHLADLYAEAIASRPSWFPDPGLADQIADQLRERKLAEEDFDLLLCTAHIIGRRFTGKPAPLSEPSLYQAIFIDEVQDFTEQQVFLMAEQANPKYRAVTVVGDLAQKLHNGTAIDIPACFPDRPVPRVQLTENMRQLEAPGLAWFSACFRAELQEGLQADAPSPLLAASMREHAHELRGPSLVPFYGDEDLVEQIVETLQSVHPYQTAAVISNDTQSAKALFERCKPALVAQMVDAELSQKIDLSRRHVRHFTSVTHAKGLEFDVVLVPYLEHYELMDRGHVNALYVALTRARRQLVLLSHADRPESSFDRLFERYENTLGSICASEAA